MAAATSTTPSSHQTHGSTPPGLLSELAARGGLVVVGLAVGEEGVEARAGPELVDGRVGTCDRDRVGAADADTVTVVAGGDWVTVTTGGAGATVGEAVTSALRVGVEESSGECEGLRAGAVGEPAPDCGEDAAGRLGEPLPHDDSNTQAMPTVMSLKKAADMALDLREGAAQG